MTEGTIEGRVEKITERAINGQGRFFIKIGGKDISGFGNAPEGVKEGDQCSINYKENRGKDGKLYNNFVSLGSDFEPAKTYSQQTVKPQNFGMSESKSLSSYEAKDTIMVALSAWRGLCDMIGENNELNADQKLNWVRERMKKVTLSLKTGNWDDW